MSPQEKMYDVKVLVPKSFTKPFEVNTILNVKMFESFIESNFAERKVPADSRLLCNLLYSEEKVVQNGVKGMLFPFKSQAVFHLLNEAIRPDFQQDFLLGAIMYLSQLNSMHPIYIWIPGYPFT